MKRFISTSSDTADILEIAPSKESSLLGREFARTSLDKILTPDCFLLSKVPIEFSNSLTFIILMNEITRVVSSQISHLCKPILAPKSDLEDQEPDTAPAASYVPFTIANDDPLYEPPPTELSPTHGATSSKVVNEGEYTSNTSNKM